MVHFRSPSGSPSRFRGAKPLAVALAAVFIAAACTTAATQAPPTAAPTGGATAAPTTAPTTGPTPKPSFQVAFTSIGLSSLPFLAAIDELRAQGYTIATPEIAQSELVAEGVAQGNFQFGSGANNATMIAIEKGFPLQLVVDRTSNEWTVGGVASITSCADLSGKRIAVHSPGAVSTAMLRAYIANNCPEIAFDPLVIEGSQNRLAALLAGQIDASPLELGDWISLSTQRPGEYNLIANFAESVPELHPTSVYTNSDWAASNQAVVQDVVRELLIQHRKIADESGYLLSLLQKYLPEEAANADLAKLITDTYRDLKIFDVNGGLTTAALDYTSNFFGPSGTGSTTALLTADQIANLTYLDAVLAELGRR